MKLDQIYIRHYGPLQKDLELDDGINIVHGPNESGKSLLVEALLKRLADGSVSDPVISDIPEGFVEVSNDTVSETLQDGDWLTTFCEENYNQEIRAEELRNIFVIRSGDLTFESGDNFYSHITDKLTGRRVEEIDEVQDALIDAGRLTNKNYKISSKQKFHDAGNQLDAAKSLRDDVETYIEEAREDGLDRAETEFFAAQREEIRLEQRKDLLEKAEKEDKKQQRYTELHKEKEDIKENLAELKQLPNESDLDSLDNRLEELTEKEGQQSELEEQKDSSLSLAKWSIAGGVVGFALLLGAGFPAVGVLAPIAFLIGAGYFWYQAKQAGESAAEVSVEEEKILSDARAAGISVEDRQELRGKISDIRTQREELGDDNQGSKAVLERELDFEADSMEDVVSAAENSLEDLEADIDDSLDIEYDEEEHERVKSGYTEAKKKREKLKKSLDEHTEKLQEFREKAYELEFREFVGEPLDLEIENLDALQDLVKRLDEFIEAIEDGAEASRVAIEIFDEIQEEEKEETAELFEEGSRATEIFHEVTDGRYNRVTYDNEENQLKVVKSTGEEFTPEQLSDGTRDQLYLAIRVALGEEVLEGESGFFVMDDAFLTSDSTRLQTQSEVVSELADDGWQVIYLSSKEDAISALGEKTENEVLELQPLE